MLQLTSSPTPFQPSGKIVRAAEYQTWLDASAILAEARAEAERILKRAEEQAKVREQEGYDQGLMDGRMLMAEKMMDAVSKTVDYLTGVEDEVVRIVTKALEKILGQIDDKDLVMRVVKSCLSLARQERTVTLRVRPEDASAVKARLAEVLADHPGISFVQVEADSRLTRGGCILETEMGVVDASVDVQLEAIRRSLAKSVKGK